MKKHLIIIMPILLLTAASTAQAQRPADTTIIREPKSASTHPHRADTPRTQSLDTATISARRILITNRIDGFSFDARQTRPAAGETATDLLRKLPGVLIDQTGGPIIRGSGQIKLVIDGRPSEAYATSIPEALKTISADNIAKVEIITNPSARYDTEGVDAVINIFTKKRLDDGAAGSLNAQADWRMTQLQYQATWRKHRWILGTDGGRYTYHYSSWSTLNRQSFINHLLQTQSFDEHARNKWAAINATFIIDSLTTMNLRYQSGHAHSTALIDYDNNTTTTSSFTGSNDSATTATTIHTINPAHRNSNTINWGLFSSARNHKWEYDAMATWFNAKRFTDYTQAATPIDPNTPAAPTTTSHTTLDNDEIAIQADLTRHINKNSQLETGAKSSLRYFKNENLLTSGNRTFQSFFFHRTIIALYASYTLSIKDWKFRTGARYEQTHWPLHFADTTLTPPDYINFLPNATISKSIGKNHNLSIGYSRKLIRPYIDNLNPVVNYIDSLNIQYGNPALKPAYSNTYELNYNFKRSIWLVTSSLFLRQTLHSIENLRLLQPGGITASTYANIANNNAWGLTGNLFIQPKNLTLNWTNTLSYFIFNSTGYPKRKGIQYNTGLECSVKPTPTLTFSGMGYYATDYINWQGSREGWRNYAITIAKDLPHTGLSLSLRIESIFTHYQYITEKSSDQTYSQATENRYISRSLKIGATWKFGKKEIKIPTSRTQTVEY